MPGTTPYPAEHVDVHRPANAHQDQQRRVSPITLANANMNAGD